MKSPDAINIKPIFWHTAQVCAAKTVGGEAKNKCQNKVYAERWKKVGQVLLSGYPVATTLKINKHSLTPGFIYRDVICIPGKIRCAYITS